MYAIGIDLGEPTTAWACSSNVEGAAGPEGTVPSAVFAGPDGSLRVAGPGDEPVPGAVSGFVGSLGSTEPVMVGGTPYGVEALVAGVLAAAVDAGSAAMGAPPDVVALVHEDDLDPYRVSLLNEAARVAGVPADRLTLVARSAVGGAGAVGAAQFGVASLPAPPADSTGGGGHAVAGAGGIAAGGAAGVVGAAALSGAAEGATAVAAELGEAGVAAAAGPSGVASGPVGSSVGPGGSSIGPAGTTSGPVGTSVGPAGASGTAGPAGTGGLVAAKSSLPWIPIGIAAVAVVAVIAVVGAVAFGGGDDPDEEAVAVTTEATVVESVAVVPVDTESVETIASTVADTTVETEPSTTLNPDIDLSAFVGDWVLCNPSTSGTPVSAAVEYSFAASGPNQLLLEYELLVYSDSIDCSTTGISGGAASYTVDIVGETVIDGVPAVQATARDEKLVMAAVGDQLHYGTNPGGDGFPTAFDPATVYSRRV